MKLLLLFISLGGLAGTGFAVDLKVDFNDRDPANNTLQNTEGGFQSMVMSAAPAGAQTIATTATFGAQTLTITTNATYDDRKRALPVNNETGFTRQALLQDFIFAVYDPAKPADGGLDIEVAGLEPGKAYAVTFWSFDDDSNGTRVSDWVANGLPTSTHYTFDGRVPPETNLEYHRNFWRFADGNGKILISARRNIDSVDTNGAASHGVYLNGLWVRDLFVDTDSDQMDDTWETTHGLQVGVDDRLQNADQDFLNNLGEYEAQTDPQDPDTDDDGLVDGYERNGGVYVGNSNTGTSPLNPDTDGDGLLDGQENPNLAFTAPYGYLGTDPNKYDSDGDSFGDGTEHNWPTNPRDPAIFPHPGGHGTLSVDFENVDLSPQSGFTGFVGSGAVDVDNLTGVIGDYTVTIAAAGTATLQSRDRAAVAGGGDFNPLFRDFIFAAGSDQDGDGLDVTLSGLAPLTEYPVFLWSFDPSSTATPRHSTWLASDGPGPPVVKIPLYILEGTALPVTSADRRLKFTATTDASGRMIIQGRKQDGYTAATINVFLNALVVGAPVSDDPLIVITSIGPVTSQGMRLSWDSVAGTVYRIETSPDLDHWTIARDDVPGIDGPRAFIDSTAPIGTRERYYRVVGRTPE